MPQWQPTSHCATPAAESLLMDNFEFGMPDSSRCEFGATGQDLETELVPSQNKGPQ